MAHHDRRGLPISTASDRAAELYREGVDLMVCAWPGADRALDGAIEADPDFALAHAARARLHAVRAEPDLARARIAVARELVERRGDARERSHVEVLGLAVAGRSAQALDRALAHADTWPRDIIVLGLPLGAFGLFAFSGMADHDQARVDLCERHAGHFADDDWWFATFRGWALTENGEVARGRALSARAFELRRENAAAVHGLSHAMFEDGSVEDADALITGWLPTYDRAAPLYSHISWHQALVALEHGDAERALAIYAERVQPSVAAGAPINIVTDAASLLWRLHAYGHVPSRSLWDDAAAYAGTAFPRAGLPFVDAHMALIAAATGDREALETRLAAFETGTIPAGPAVTAIGRAMLAFAAEDYAGCARILQPVATDIVRIGGSGAQRQIVEDTLLLALMRSGETRRAHDLLDRRLHRRPSPRDTRWRELSAA